jgi:hypothetical protein
VLAAAGPPASEAGIASSAAVLGVLAVLAVIGVVLAEAGLLASTGPSWAESDALARTVDGFSVVGSIAEAGHATTKETNVATTARTTLRERVTKFRVFL